MKAIRAAVVAISASTTILLAHAAAALEVHESNLWFGGDEGIEIVWRSGKNLAFTDESPKVDSRMTEHARTFDQALLKIGGANCQQDLEESVRLPVDRTRLEAGLSFGNGAG